MGSHERTYHDSALSAAGRLRCNSVRQQRRATYQHPVALREVTPDQSIRLVKHWFNCHLFTGHVNEELVELVVARVFTQPYPWDTPSSVMVGFLRTLHFLSRWDWQQDPLIVDLGGELDQDTITAIRTRFSGWRSIDPAMNTVALFVASSTVTCLYVGNKRKLRGVFMTHEADALTSCPIGRPCYQPGQ